MSGQKTRQWILANKPETNPIFEGDNATFKLQTTTLPAPGKDQLLVKMRYMSNDPAQRGWIQKGMDPARLYTPPVEEGAVMRAFGVCEVVQSNSENFKPGQLVIATTGWSEYAVIESKDARPVNADDKAGIRPTHFIGALGGPGMTAYYGLVDVVGTTANDAIVVSGAAGATGSMVVQVAKHILGCKKIIGIAGGDKKCRWVESLGADICIDYKSPSWKTDLTKATDGFVDVYFDNVGGEILDFMLTRLKMHGRVAACGSVATYNSPGSVGIKNYFDVISMRLNIKGFIVYDVLPRAGEIVGKLIEKIKEGKIKLAEDGETVVPTKFEDVPKTWRMLFTGGNTGKLVTELTG